MVEEQKAIAPRLEELKKRFTIPQFPWKGKSSAVIVILALLMILYRLCLVYVEPDEFGIKVVRVGTHRGVQKEIYRAGLHLVIPGFQQMHRLPIGVLVLELTNYPTTAAFAARQERPPTFKPPMVSSWTWMSRSSIALPTPTWCSP